ncbi:type 2 DNA topoisomerase 6 subunit B-like [Euphorbia lathyris]|uniref:type 2 DNA topoisomerase 6 subunit B-like n=1 Tax=Euphorbia lathyris TaxID=212925 RepID=UPI0033135F0A
MMQVSTSVAELCVNLISSAFQRCRASEDVCRLSVVLKSSLPSDPSAVRISISDTGIGSSLEEFQSLKGTSEALDAEQWDGLLRVTTTSASDNEVYFYLLNFRETSSSRRLTRLPSKPKNGAKFSGTEAYLSISDSIDVLAEVVKHFFQKILILKIPNVAVELVIEREDVPGSRRQNVFLANESNTMPCFTSNVEGLKSGLEDYVLKHGHRLTQNCDSCFPTREYLKVGSGVVSSLESHGSSGLIMEVAITISELDPTCPCFSQCSSKTEVLSFEDFNPCSISKSFLNALSSIDWKSYGMTLRNVVDQGGCFLEWDNLPSQNHMTMVLHCYHKQAIVPSTRCKTQSNCNLVKRALKIALDDLKENCAGVLLSAHALKIRSYAPDLARSIAGLILSSNDSDFKEECLSLIGLQCKESEGEIVKDCIQEKIVSVIDMNDRKPQRRKEMAAAVAVAPSLFEDDRCWTSNFRDKEYQGEDDSEDLFDFLD